MKYTTAILHHPEFLRLQEQILELEKDRIYCRHDLTHLLDVCRMAWIMYLEDCRQNDKRKMSEEKDRFYVTGLLHDIGRAAQYETGEHHAPAGQRIAAGILNDISYPQEWMEETLQIVGEHHGRTRENGSAPVLAERKIHMTECHGEKSPFIVEMRTMADYIRKADHLSRNCFCCRAADTCKWKEEERNQTVYC